MIAPSPKKIACPSIVSIKNVEKVVDKNSGAFTTLGYWIVGGMGWEEEKGGWGELHFFRTENECYFE